MPEQLTKEELKALAAEARQEIVKLLSKRPYTASELSKILGKHVTTVTEHLGNLEKSGLIRKKEEGHKWKYYVLTAKGEKLLKPQFYSWTIMLSLSVVAIFIGGGLLSASLFVGGTAALQAERQAPALDAGMEVPAFTPPPPTFDLLQFVPLILIVLGIIGIAFALWKRKSAKVQVLAD